MSLPICYLLFMAALTTYSVFCQSYEDSQKIFNEILGSSRYNPDVRPVINQSEPIYVNVSFEILSIVEINDITQSFICNGLVHVSWLDERARWNTSDYGGIHIIHPSPKLIWRPRMVLVNTLAQRDLFEDDYSPINLYADGFVMWFPGSLFPTSCKLDLTRYPFDEQTCIIRMFPMGWHLEELEFKPQTVLFESYTVNGVWDLVGKDIYSGYETVTNGDYVSYFEVSFTLRRRPTFFLLNVLLPVVLLSFLNIMVFVIPVDSGEKISYGITVSLALTVFMSIVSSLLPQASDNIPHVIIYLFSLLVISLLTVVDSIVIVFMHHMEGKEENSMKARRNFKSAFTAINLQNRVVSPMLDGFGRNASLHDPLETGAKGKPLKTVDSLLSRHGTASDHRRASRQSWVDVMTEEDYEVRGRKHDDDNGDNSKGGNINNDESDRNNKYKTIGKHIDMASFVVFTVAWLILTLWIFIQIAV